MKFYIDCVEIPGDDSLGDVGLPKYVAWSREHRLGGGDVWIPYLYRNGQEVNMYQWRYGNGVALYQQWLQEIMDQEKLLMQV